MKRGIANKIWHTRKEIMPRRDWLEASRDWGLSVVNLIEHWVHDNNQGPYDLVTSKVVRKRLGLLDDFIRHGYDDIPSHPMDIQDAAALIVLPRPHAFVLAQKLFSGARGWERVEPEDLTFNLDWFYPSNFQRT